MHQERGQVRELVLGDRGLFLAATGRLQDYCQHLEHLTQLLAHSLREASLLEVAEQAATLALE